MEERSHFVLKVQMHPGQPFVPVVTEFMKPRQFASHVEARTYAKRYHRHRNFEIQEVFERGENRTYSK